MFTKRQKEQIALIVECQLNELIYAVLKTANAKSSEETELVTQKLTLIQSALIDVAIEHAENNTQG